MWAAQHFPFEMPNRWMTSGGLGTMGYGLPAAIGVQVAHPDALVIDIAGEAVVQMTMQEMSTAVQYELPIKIFILNNERMGMVRQWQELLHGGRYAHCYSREPARFRQAGGGLWRQGHPVLGPGASSTTRSPRCSTKTGRCCSTAWSRSDENCLPMIPSGKPHNEMILPDFDEDIGDVIDAKGRELV